MVAREIKGLRNANILYSYSSFSPPQQLSIDAVHQAFISPHELVAPFFFGSWHFVLWYKVHWLTFLRHEVNEVFRILASVSSLFRLSPSCCQ